MKLSYLKAIVSVAEKGSLRAAARHLGMAQPALSRSIQQAEIDLGVTLFERHATGVTPTVAGRHYLQRASAILLDMERARDEVLQLAGSTLGKVTVGLSTVPHIAWLPSVLDAFRERYPSVKLTIYEGLFSRMQQSLEQGELDFYIGPVTDRVMPGALMKERLCTNNLLVFCRRGHPLRNAKSLAELVDAQWVDTPVSEIAGADLAPLFQKHGLPSPRYGVRAQSTLTVLITASSTDLLTMLPQQFLKFPGTRMMLENINVRETLASPVIFTVRRAQSVLTPAAQYFHDLLAQAAKEEPK